MLCQWPSNVNSAMETRNAVMLILLLETVWLETTQHTQISPQIRAYPIAKVISCGVWITASATGSFSHHIRPSASSSRLKGKIPRLCPVFVQDNQAFHGNKTLSHHPYSAHSHELTSKYTIIWAGWSKHRTTDKRARNFLTDVPKKVDTYWRISATDFSLRTLQHVDPQLLPQPQPSRMQHADQQSSPAQQPRQHQQQCLYQQPRQPQQS